MRDGGGAAPGRSQVAVHLNAQDRSSVRDGPVSARGAPFEHEIRQLEASKRRVLNQMSMNMQRARQERQLLTAASRTGQLPPIDESEQKPRAAPRRAVGAHRPCCSTRSIGLCSLARPTSLPTLNTTKSGRARGCQSHDAVGRRCGLRTAVARGTRVMPCRAVAGPTSSAARAGCHSAGHQRRSDCFAVCPVAWAHSKAHLCADRMRHGTARRVERSSSARIAMSMTRASNARPMNFHVDYWNKWHGLCATCVCNI